MPNQSRHPNCIDIFGPGFTSTQNFLIDFREQLDKCPINHVTQTVLIYLARFTCAQNFLNDFRKQLDKCPINHVTQIDIFGRGFTSTQNFRTFEVYYRVDKIILRCRSVLKLCDSLDNPLILVSHHTTLP